jgi:hypothetical protein
MIAFLLVSALSVEATERPATPPAAASKTELVVSSPVPTDFKPGDREIELASKDFDTFWNLQQAGNFSAAYAMMSAQNRAQMTEADWTTAQIQRLKDGGGDLARKLLRITWYPNPPSVDTQGIYTAVDYIAHTQNGGLRCGYVILVNAGTNPVQVMRVDMTILPAELVSGTLPRADVFPQLPCYLGPDVVTAFGKANQ